MGEILAFEESHIPEVAALEMKVFHREKGPGGTALREYFRDIFLRNPWRNAELPSLVYRQGGAVTGFLGVIPRPMLFRGRAVRAAVATQFMVDPEAHQGFAGLELLRRFFAGPQDLSYTDGATEAAYTVWTAAGARAAQLYSVQWVRTLRPFGDLRAGLESHPRLPGAARRLVRMGRPLWGLADAAAAKIPARALAPPRSELATRITGADELLECARAVGWREPLRPSYEPESFRWLLAQAAATTRHGALRTAAVHDSSGAPAGWFAYYAKRGGRSAVLQVAASARHFDGVFDALLEDAWSQGAASVSGQANPRFLLNLSRGCCSFQYPGNGVLIHSRDREILSCVLEGGASLCRLDGEWWTRFAVGDWT